MIEGTVTSEGSPTIQITLGGRDWVAIIDTGFNGDLELPLLLREEVNPRYVGQVESALGGGQLIEEELYLVDFPFDGATTTAEATFVGGEQILMGTHLMRSHRLEINFVSKTLSLEQVPT